MLWPIKIEHISTVHLSAHSNAAVQNTPLSLSLSVSHMLVFGPQLVGANWT